MNEVVLSLPLILHVVLLSLLSSTHTDTFAVSFVGRHLCLLLLPLFFFFYTEPYEIGGIHPFLTYKNGNFM